MHQDSTSEPPAFLQLAAHPVRWRLLRELAGGDRLVRELTHLLGESQSLVSYHLALLRDGGLVRTKRSSADGRASYYGLDLGRCADLLESSGVALHPGLRFDLRPPPAPALARPGRPPRVLFLCTGNGARSQMAEALLASLSGGTVEVCSAGSRPKPVHPDAVRVMGERGIDIGSARSKHLRRFARRRFDLVVTLCDRVREVCPEFPGSPTAIHWSIADPSLEGDLPEAAIEAFRRTADDLEGRISFLLSTITNQSVETTATERSRGSHG